MGIYTQGDVVNEMLGLLGEAPVNDIDVEHPLIAAGLSHLRTANAREQGRGWWFNTERTTLTPTGEGEILLPTDILTIDPIDGSLQAAQRGTRLYNLSPGTANPYTFTSPIECGLIRLLPFEDLPTGAQALVSLSAQYSFIVFFDGDAQKIDAIRLQLRDALVTLNAENIRAKDVNMLNNASFVRTLWGIRGGGASVLQYR